MAKQPNKKRPIPQPWPLQKATGIDPMIADPEDVLLYARLGATEAAEHKARLEGQHALSREERERLQTKWRWYFQALDASLRIKAQQAQADESRHHHERLEDLDQQAKEAHAAYETQRLQLDVLRYGAQLRLDEVYKRGNLIVQAQRNQLAQDHNRVVERQQGMRLWEEGRHDRILEDQGLLRLHEQERHDRVLEWQGWLRRGSCLVPFIILILLFLVLCACSVVFMTWTRW